MVLKIINPLMATVRTKAPYIAPKIELGALESLRLNCVARQTDTLEIIPQIVKDIRVLKNDKLIKTINSKHLSKTEEELLHFIKNGSISQQERNELMELLNEIKTSQISTFLKEKSGNPILEDDIKLIDNYIRESTSAMSKFIRVFDNLLFPKSINPRVIEIEKKLSELGADARLTDHEKGAERVLNAYKIMYDKGVRAFPKARYLLDNHIHNNAIPNKSLHDRYILISDDIFTIPTRYPIGSHAAQIPEGVIWYEVGHTLNYAGASGLFLINGGSFKKVAEELSIKKAVSVYATKCEDECMAEIFAGIIDGKKYPQNIINFYISRNGYIPPEIKL